MVCVSMEIVMMDIFTTDTATIEAVAIKIVTMETVVTGSVTMVTVTAQFARRDILVARRPFALKFFSSICSRFDRLALIGSTESDQTDVSVVAGPFGED